MWHDFILQAQNNLLRLIQVLIARMSYVAKCLHPNHLKHNILLWPSGMRIYGADQETLTLPLLLLDATNTSSFF